jgi:hypothetical protein
MSYQNGESGNEYNVLMRGEQSREGIFFKVEDVMTVFQMPRLGERLIRDERSEYALNKHYIWLVITSVTHSAGGSRQSRELYLTFFMFCEFGN